MTGVDYFSSTTRGLFLHPGGLERGAGDVILSGESVPAGAAVLAEVVDVPARCRVGNLEIIEAATGATDTWSTREIALARGLKFVGAIGGRFAKAIRQVQDGKGPFKKALALVVGQQVLNARVLFRPGGGHEKDGQRGSHGLLAKARQQLVSRGEIPVQPQDQEIRQGGSHL